MINSINSLIGSVMNMTAEIYFQQDTQTDSGAIQRTWVYHQTIPCRVEPLKAGGALNRADNKTFDAGSDNSYLERFQLKMKSPVAISRRARVRAVRDSDGNIVYQELDRINMPDMIFDVTASHAEIDPLGRVSYYETTLQRVLIQKNDQYTTNQ